MNRFLRLTLACAPGAPAAVADDAPFGDRAPAVTVPAFSNATCPIMGKKASKKLLVDTPKGRIYVCCVACNKKIRQDPDRAHAAAHPNVKKAGNTLCPVTGEALPEDPPTVVLQGYEVSLCCKDCVKEAQAAAQIVLAKATNANVRDVGNKVCPVTDKPVANNTFCPVGDDLIRLSSPDCVEGVREDPVAALRKAKKLAGAREEKRGEGGDHGHGGHHHGDE